MEEIMATAAVTGEVMEEVEFEWFLLVVVAVVMAVDTETTVVVIIKSL